MINEIDSRVWHAANAILRLALARKAVPFVGKHVLVNEYPKSGGTWLTEMLADALNIPFPQHRLPSLRSSMLQGHYITKNELASTVVLHRDGRDIFNSFYFHLIVGNEYTNKQRMEEIREELSITDPTDVHTNLPRFIERFSEKPFFPHFTWAQFVETWHGRQDAVETSYEALREDPAAELVRIVNARTGKDLLHEKASKIAEQHSIRSRAGKANKFRRKGIVGDWRNNFSAEAIDIFKHYNNDALIALGYEEAKDWKV